MATLPRLDNWSLYRDPYHPPESGTQLKGCVTGHPSKPDGSMIRTSAITATDEATRTVTTESGMVYVLGDADPGYVAWCEENWYKCEFPRIIKHGG